MFLPLEGATPAPQLYVCFGGDTLCPIASAKIFHFLGLGLHLGERVVTTAPTSRAAGPAREALGPQYLVNTVFVAQIHCGHPRAKWP